MPDLQQVPLIPEGTPPQLRVLLLELSLALKKHQAELAQRYLWSTLEQLLRFYTGLAMEAIEYEGVRAPSQLEQLRRSACNLEGVRQALGTCLAALRIPIKTRRSEQVLEVFYRSPDRPEFPLHTRWLGFGGEPTEIPFLTGWTPRGQHEDILAEAIRLYMPVLREWLGCSALLFLQETWNLERELRVTLAPTPEREKQGPEPQVSVLEPEDPRQVPPERLDESVAFWSQIVIGQPAPGEEAAHSQALSHLVLAFRRRAANYMARNLFEIADIEYDHVIGFCQGSSPVSPLGESLADGLSGGGCARTCLGQFELAAKDLDAAVRFYREILADYQSPEGAQAIIRTLYFRSINHRCLGQHQQALEDVQVAQDFGRLLEIDKEDLPLAATLHYEASADLLALKKREQAQAELKTTMDLLRRIAEREKTTRAELELACIRVEWAYLLDPSGKDYRAGIERKNALEAFRKIKKREPSFALGCELLRYLMERRDSWGRPDTDFLTVERDLRAARLLLEIMPRDDELKGLQSWLLKIVEERLKRSNLPRTFIREFFGLFSDLAGGVGRDYETTWQAESWMRLARLFGKHEDIECQIRCLAMACVSQQRSNKPSQIERLVETLDQVAKLVPKAPNTPGLELLGPCFQTVRVHFRELTHRAQLVDSVRAMAARWKALPPTVPARAGVARTLLSELSE